MSASEEEEGALCETQEEGGREEEAGREFEGRGQQEKQLESLRLRQGFASDG